MSWTWQKASSTGMNGKKSGRFSPFRYLQTPRLPDSEAVIDKIDKLTVTGHSQWWTILIRHCVIGCLCFLFRGWVPESYGKHHQINPGIRHWARDRGEPLPRLQKTKLGTLQKWLWQWRLTLKNQRFHVFFPFMMFYMVSQIVGFTQSQTAKSSHGLRQNKWPHCWCSLQVLESCLLEVYLWNAYSIEMWIHKCFQTK